MFRQGLGRKEGEDFETLYAEYPNCKREFVLETRPADRLDCPGENKWMRPVRKTLNDREAMAFLNDKDTVLSSTGKEALIKEPNNRPRLIIKPACRTGWFDRVVPGWATHIITRCVRSWEDGSVGIQFLAAYNAQAKNVQT